SQKLGAPISRSSSSTRAFSPAGSKIVREQLQLVAARRKALRRRLRRGVGGGGHAPEAISKSRRDAVRSSASDAVALLEFLPAAAPARVVAADLVDRVDAPLRDVRRRLFTRRGRFRDAERRR